MKVPVHIRQEAPQGPVQAYCPDLPGCSASAPTVPEALELLRRRLRAYFATSTRRPPAGTRVVHLDV